MLCAECQSTLLLGVAVNSMSTMLDMNTSASLQLQVCKWHRMMHVALHSAHNTSILHMMLT